MASKKEKQIEIKNIRNPLDDSHEEQAKLANLVKQTNLEKLENLEKMKNKIGNNGQKNLWIFIMEMLCDDKNKQLIRCTRGGAFVILKLEQVAKKWSEQRGSEKMTYDRMSRTVRWKGSNIIKDKGRRFGYKFNFNAFKILGIEPM